MAQFHPDIHWLVDFAAGSLPMSQALCVAAHLEHCTNCKSKVNELNAIGGSMIGASQSHTELDSSVSASASSSIDTSSQEDSWREDTLVGDSTLDSSMLDKLWATIDDNEQQQKPIEVQVADAPSNTPIQGSSMEASLPTCVEKLLPRGIDQLSWKKLGRSLSVARLACGDSRREVALHRLRPGRGVANHDHRGQEVTVVLRGSFSDQQGLYLPGDFLVKQAGDKHRPIASEDMECICLSVVDAPIKFTGLLTRLFNPFLKIHPAAA